MVKGNGESGHWGTGEPEIRRIAAVAPIHRFTDSQSPCRHSKTGQATSEFILMLALLTLIGIWIVHAFVGTSAGNGGGVQKMSSNAAKSIGTD